MHIRAFIHRNPKLLPLIIALLLLLQSRPADSSESRSNNDTPSRIILTLSADPARSMAVTWRTTIKTEDAVAQLAPVLTGHEAAFVKNGGTSTTRYARIENCAKSYRANTQPSMTSKEQMVYYHKVLFHDLQPNTAYAYRVGSANAWSEWNVFWTAPASGNFEFIYMGDAQNDIYSAWSHVARSAYRFAPKGAFMLFGGDLVGRGEEDAQWQEWFNGAGWIYRTMPVLATPGNHEYYDLDDDNEALTWFWPVQFTFPDNGPDGLKGEVWYLDYLDARIICLNSNEALETQAEWLKNVLKGAEDRWTIITFHHPIYSSGKDRDNSELRSVWIPIFEHYGADLVLAGHDHTYARTGRLVNGQPAPNGSSGVVYLNSVSGPKSYPFNPDHAGVFERTGEGIQLFQVIRVAADSLQVEALTADGSRYDAFELKKAGTSVRLIDFSPTTSDRRW